MLDQAWEELPSPWLQAFELAWESYRAGSPPVGAVVLGPDGAVVARGRSRRSEGAGSAPPNHLAGSRLAHAEINALAQLPVDHHAGHELYVTLESCLLCWAAIRIARVPLVHFAGQDPQWRFLGQLAGPQPALVDRATSMDGPMAGPFGAWATLLPLVERLWRDPTGIRIDHFRQSVPALVDLAEQIVSDGTAARFIGWTQQEALASIWDDLAAAAG